MRLTEARPFRSAGEIRALNTFGCGATYRVMMD